MKPLVVLFALLLILSACGSDAESGVSGEGEGDQSTETPQGEADTDGGSDSDSGSGSDSDAGSGLTGGFQVTQASPEMISGQPAPIIEIVTVDDQTIGVRYENGSEPCSLADVAVTESDTEILVSLQTGLHPDAAAMSCIAQVIDYEIQVALDAPIGDREIVAAEA